MLPHKLSDPMYYMISIPGTTELNNVVFFQKMSISESLVL